MASYLLFGTYLLPGILINMNDVILLLVTTAFSLCLLYSAASLSCFKNAAVVMIGIITSLTLLCNLPAGCMMIVLCGIFLILNDGNSHNKLLYTALFGFVGLILGLCITHFFLISLQDCLEFLKKGILQTTRGGSASHHSLSTVIYVILFGVRDLAITTILLCGITYICKIFHQKFNKKWLTIALAIVSFMIIYKWQVRPRVSIASILCWQTIIFLNYHVKLKTINRKDLLLVLFAFVMPIGLVFGTNTNIIEKALYCGTPWGLLLFYIYYKTEQRVRHYAILGCSIVAFSILSISNRAPFQREQEKLHFDAEKPIAQMNLTPSQKAYYEEIYANLKDNGYQSKKDTILGFCFNEMTVVAMDAKPYTNDQQPEEFLLHDLNKYPSPKYMILSEWDSIVLYNRLSELNWDFPQGYKYYKCVNNPDPESGLNSTQSIIYSRVINQ